MRRADYFVVTDKPKPDGAADPLVEARSECWPGISTTNRASSSSRTRPGTGRPMGTATRADYETAVADWHEARAAAYEQVLRDHDGDAGFLVWGDPAFYDSTLRVLEKVRHHGSSSIST